MWISRHTRMCLLFEYAHHIYNGIIRYMQYFPLWTHLNLTPLLTYRKKIMRITIYDRITSCSHSGHVLLTIRCYWVLQNLSILCFLRSPVARWSILRIIWRHAGSILSHLCQEYSCSYNVVPVRHNVIREGNIKQPWRSFPVTLLFSPFTYEEVFLY